MIKYYITIVDRNTKTVHNLVRDKETVTPTIDNELGGWDNLYAACTGDRYRNKDEYFTAGTTKDNSKCFSILAIDFED